jgi:hypothetical protein
MAARQSPDESPFDADAWAQQDGVIICEPQSERRSHIGHRWDERCQPGWEGYDVRSAWRESEPVDYGDDEVAARLHAEAGVLLVVELGFVQTVLAEATVDVQPKREQSAEQANRSSEMRCTEGPQ